MKWKEWFKTDGVDMRWLARSPVDKTARCDRSFQHVVTAGQPRLVVDSKQGPDRKRGHGRRVEYLCEACALSGYGVRAPTEVNESQEKLF